MNAPHTTYGSGSTLLFTFHGYGMDGRQFQVFRESLCADYQIIGFHLPYHKGGPGTHIGWLETVIGTIRQIMTEKGIHECSIAGYSVGAKVALMLLPYFNEQVKDVYLFAPYGLTKHWGISFLESAVGKAFFRLIAVTSLPLLIIDIVYTLGIISKADHGILKRELADPEMRQNLQKTFLLMSNLKFNRNEVLTGLNVVSGKVQLVFGKHDIIFSLAGFKEHEQLNNLDILEVEEGHWLMTEKLDALLLDKVREVS